MVVGLEVDISGSTADGTDSRTFQIVGIPGEALTTSLENDLKWFSTVRGRVGFLLDPALIVYGTGGLAFGETEQKLTVGLEPAPGLGVIFSGVGGGIVCGRSACMVGSSSDTSVGWTAGGGFELALTNNVSLKGEYLYVDLGDSTVTATPTNPSPVNAFLRAETETTLHVVRAELNFGF